MTKNIGDNKSYKSNFDKRLSNFDSFLSYLITTVCFFLIIFCILFVNLKIILNNTQTFTISFLKYYTVGRYFFVCDFISYFVLGCPNTSKLLIFDPIQTFRIFRILDLKKSQVINGKSDPIQTRTSNISNISNIFGILKSLSFFLIRLQVLFY